MHTLAELRILIFALELAAEKTSELQDPELQLEIADMERLIERLIEQQAIRKKILGSPVMGLFSFVVRQNILHHISYLK